MAYPILFDAVLHPHRSLPPSGFTLLMVVFGGSSAAVGVAFLIQGAWPVLGFLGLEIGLVYLAFRINYRDAQVYETVRLTERALTVWRITRTHEPQSWSFEPAWVRVSMDDPPQHHSALRVSSHGHSLRIGAFLSPEERLELAHALRGALLAWRSGQTGVVRP